VSQFGTKKGHKHENALPSQGIKEEEIVKQTEQHVTFRDNPITLILESFFFIHMCVSKIDKVNKK